MDGGNVQIGTEEIEGLGFKGGGHGVALGAEGDLGQVLDEQGAAHRAQQGDVFGRVQEALVGNLVDEDTGNTGRYEGYQQAQEEVGRNIGVEQISAHGADHDHFAVGKGDEPDDADDQRITNGHQGVDAALGQAVDKLLEHIHGNTSFG